MTLSDFVTTYTGKPVDFDGFSSFQCVDLTKAYLFRLFGIPNASRGYAVDWWHKTGADILTKFDRLKMQTPAPGDIVVLNGLVADKAGHIVIALSSPHNGLFSAFEQNGSSGNGRGLAGDAPRTRQIPVTRILGILRPRTTSDPTFKQYYSIHRGDTLWALSRAWGMDLSALLALNPGILATRLRVGQKIRKT